MAISEKDQQIIDACRDTDEPIFVFRAKDILSATMIAQYHTQFQRRGPSNRAKLDQIAERLREFERWQNENVGKVRYPD